MMPSPAGGDREPYDILGVGFGPSNMALGVLLEELQEDEGRDVRRLFLEARAEPCWHPGLLLENSQIQITVLKDLATVRNPRSRFTFLNYLQDRGRLYEFLNLRDLFPSRLEFNDYLCWVTDKLADRVRLGRRVTGVHPVADPSGDGVELLEVEAEDLATGETERHRARHLVVATGGTPWTPPGIEVGEDSRAFHASRFLQRMERDFPDRDRDYRFVVVGAGQSGAELFYYLCRNYPNARVTACMRGYGYKPVDESDFTNEVFFPEKVDFIYDLPNDRRRQVVDSYRDVNYAVVDHPLIRKIYRLLYDEKVMGRERARVVPYSRLVEVREEPDRAVAAFEHVLHEGRFHEVEADGVVLATGFRWSTRHPLLEELDDWFLRDGEEYRVDRDYGIAAREGFRPRVYLQGYNERTHGISETVLSLLPVRAQDIWESVDGRLDTAPQRPRPVAAG